MAYYLIKFRSLVDIQVHHLSLLWILTTMSTALLALGSPQMLEDVFYIYFTVFSFRLIMTKCIAQLAMIYMYIL